MDDPLSLVVKAAVEKVIEATVGKVWESGQKLIEHFATGGDRAVRQAAYENALKMANHLADRMSDLERSQQITRQAIQLAFNQPAIHNLMRIALIESAQTDSEEKHALLARLVADRLTSESEGTRALASEMAAQAIAHMTSRQLRILGLQVNLASIRPASMPVEIDTVNQYNDWIMPYLERQLTPYIGLTLGAFDLSHLEALSCLRVDEIRARSLVTMLSSGTLAFDVALFGETNVGKEVTKLWANGLSRVMLTSVGSIVGVYASDMLTGVTTVMTDWDT